MVKLLKKLDQSFEEIVCMLLFVLLVGLVLVQVLFRFVFNFSLDWTEELSRFVFIWLVYMAVALAAKAGRHIRVEVMEHVLPPRIARFLPYIAEICWFGFCIYMVFHGAEITAGLMNSAQLAPVTQISMGYVYIIVPFGFALMAFRVLQQLWKRFRGKKEPLYEHLESIDAGGV